MTGLREEARRLRLAHAYVGEACYGSLVAAEQLEARASMLEQEQDDEPVVAVVHVTTPEGVLLGTMELTADDLRHPVSIGSRLVADLPPELRPDAR